MQFEQISSSRESSNYMSSTVCQYVGKHSPISVTLGICHMLINTSLENSVKYDKRGVGINVGEGFFV